MRIYINGDRVTNFDSAGYPVLNEASVFNSATTHEIGHRINPALYYLDGYLSNVHFIDGQALDADDFGETVDGYWKSKDYAGTYGTNGFRLTFEDDVVSEGFNTVTYSGNGSSSGQSISGLGFSPDLVWLKERTSTSANILIDTVRGANTTLESNNTNAEFTPSSVGLASFDGDGFTIGSANGAYNSGSDTYVGWAWDAGENNAPTGHSSVTFSATAGSAGKVRNLGFTPDLVWVKARNTTQSHQLFDSVRGDNKILYSNLTNAESAQAAGYFTLEDDGFNYGSSTFSSHNYVAWGWDAGSGSPVSNTDGSITSTVKANPSYGFSITSYTGTGANATVGHSLGVQPSMIIVKNRDTGTWWDVYHSALGGTKYLRLNSTNGEFTGSVVWNDTDPTSSVFSIGTVNDVNASGEDYIAYCFAEVAGYSSIGSKD
jgi:hypothetical protein